jgi:ATP-dependent Clp protease adapter protein ClpS
MSDRDGIVLECEPPAPKSARIAASLVVAIIAFGLAARLDGVLRFAASVLAGLLAIAPLAVPLKVRFRARQIELRWFFYRRDVRYVDLVGFSGTAGGVVLRLADGSTLSIDIHTETRPAHVAHEELTTTLTRATGLTPGSTAPAVRTAALDAAVARASRIARTRGSNVVESEHFVAALLAGPEREFLVRAGLRSPTSREGDDYRTASGDLPPDSLFAEVLASSRVDAMQHERTDITPNHVLLELFREGDPAIDSLTAAGLTPMRFVDALEHGLAPDESDARAFGTLTEQDLLRGIEGEVRLVILRDEITPTVVLVDVLVEHVEGERHDLEALAERVATDGRAHIDGLPSDEAARTAIDMMQHARSLGSPLLVVLEASP